MLSSPSTTRPRPPSQTRRMPPTSPLRTRTQSHTPSRVEPDAPPPYSPTSATRPNPRHSLTEIDDMLNVAGSVVRNRERELDAAALASRSLLEENKLMFAKREALLARLPLSPRSSMALSSSSSSLQLQQQQQPTNRSSSWSTCSDDSDADYDGSVATTPRIRASTPDDSLESHRIITPTHSASASLDMSPAARLAPTQAERIAALHAGLISPPPTAGLSRTSRRVSVSPAAVSHLQDANAALLARVEELEEATAKAQTDGAARMRRLQAEAELLRSRLGEAERANEGLRTEAEREREKLRVRTQSATSRRMSLSPEPVVDFAPSATWRPEFRSLRGGSARPDVVPKTQTPTPATVKRSLTTSTASSRARTQSSAPALAPSRTVPSSPLKHTPLKPSLLRHQRANSLHASLGVGKPASGAGASLVGMVLEEQSETEGGRSPSVGNSPVGMRPSPTRVNVGILPFPTSADPDEDMSPSSTRVLAQELVAKINELRSTNEEILQQRDALKDMLEVAEAEADELKRVCERLENEVERNSEGTASGGETVVVPSGRRSRASGGRGSGSDRERGLGSDREERGLQLNPLGLGGLGESPLGLGGLGEDDEEEMPAGWMGSVRGRKRTPGGALESLAAELGVSAEIQAPTDDEVTDFDVPGGVDLASELMSAVAPPAPPAPVTPTAKTFGLPHGPVTPKRSASRNGRTTPSGSISISNSHSHSAASSAKRGLGNRGMANRSKTNPRRVRKALSSVVFKALPSPGSSPTGAGVGVSPVEEEGGQERFQALAVDKFEMPQMDKVQAFQTPQKDKVQAFQTPQKDKFQTPQKDGEERREFVTPEVYLTPASSLRIPGGVAFPELTDDEDAKSPSVNRSRKDSTMAQLRAALDPLLANVVQGKSGAVRVAPPSPVQVDGKLAVVRRKPSNLRLLFADERNMEPWETKLRDLYSEIRALEQEDAGMSSAGEDGGAWRGSRRARALGRLSLRRRVGGGGGDDGVSDYAADDSEACDLTPIQTTNNKKEEAQAAGFELARKLQQKSMSTFLEVLLLIQFAVVLIVFVYTAVRRGPKAVLGAQKRS